MRITRFMDREPYAFSVGDQFTRQLTKPTSPEEVRHTLYGTIAKSADKTSNMKETGPVVNQSVQRELYAAFNRSNVSDRLRQHFGNMSRTPKPMSRAERVQMAYESFIPIHYGNETMNGLMGLMALNQAGRSYALARLALHSVFEMAFRFCRESS